MKVSQEKLEKPSSPLEEMKKLMKCGDDKHLFLGTQKYNGHGLQPLHMLTVHCSGSRDEISSTIIYQRLSWAREHIGWSLNEWKTVASSDESRFQLVRADGRVRVWRRPHEAMDPSCQQGTVQAGGGSIMVWAVFTWHGLVPLVQLNRSLTGKEYLQLLEDHLQPFMDFTYSNNDGIFMDDNAPCHRATIVRDWLEEHSGQFQRMWPPRSPDMNPIEHLWDIIERSVRAQNPALSTLSQLSMSIEAAWLNIPAGDFQRLVESMPRRIAALRRAKGGPTKY
ncbi:Transposable element Tcb2 transposase, partial [Stegodyphus mimosarum]